MNIQTTPTSANHNILTSEELAALSNFGPAITDEQVNELERAISSKSHAKQRRLVLLACSRSADDLSRLSIEQPEAFEEMLELIEASKDSAQGWAEMTDMAYFRMLLAGCRQEAASQS